MPCGAQPTAVRDDPRRGRLYTWPDGVESPSVTTIITRGLGLTYDSPEAAARGTYIHEACALLDGGGDGTGLDWRSVPEEWHGYLHSWEKARQWIGIEDYEVEVPVRSVRFGFSGRADRIGQRYLLDLKTGEKEAWHRLQTSAYAEAYREATGKRSFLSRASVYLRPSGTPKIEDHPQKDLLGEFQVFLALMQVYHWRVATAR